MCATIQGRMCGIMGFPCLFRGNFIIVVTKHYTVFQALPT